MWYKLVIIGGFFALTGWVFFQWTWAALVGLAMILGGVIFSGPARNRHGDDSEVYTDPGGHRASLWRRRGAISDPPDEEDQSSP